MFRAEFLGPQGRYALDIAVLVVRCHVACLGGLVAHYCQMPLEGAVSRNK